VAFLRLSLFKKILTEILGLTLRKRLLRATKELERQNAGLAEFSQAQEEQVHAWKKAVDDFETGASAINPYELPQTGRWRGSMGSDVALTRVSVQAQRCVKSNWSLRAKTKKESASPSVTKAPQKKR
jgi:hypothetical protein